MRNPTTPRKGDLCFAPAANGGVELVSVADAVFAARQDLRVAAREQNRRELEQRQPARERVAR